MKRLLIIWLILCSSAFASFTQATQAIKTSSTVTTLAVAFAGAVATGDALVCGASWDNQADTGSASDNINGAWTSSVTVNNGSTRTDQLYYFKNSASAGAGGLTVTITISPTAAHIWFSCIDFAGEDTANPLDGTPSTKAVTTAQTSITSNTYTSSTTDDLFAFLTTGSNVTVITAGSGYTVPAASTNARAGNEYQLAVASGNQTASISWTSTAAATIILGGFTNASGGAADVGGDKRHKLEMLEEFLLF